MPIMSAGGLFSRIPWGDRDVQLQTELIQDEGKRIVTIILASGAVIGRSDRKWLDYGEGQILEQRRISSFHDRLVRAIIRLRDERDAGIEDLTRLFDRLATVALRFSRSSAQEVLDALPSARWVALSSSEGRLLDTAPAHSPGGNWCPLAAGLRIVAEELSGLFSCGGVSDIVMRTEAGYIVVAPIFDSAFVAGTDGAKLTELRNLLGFLLRGEGSENEKVK